MRTRDMVLILVALAVAVSMSGTAWAEIDLEEPCSGLEFQVDTSFRLSSFEGSAVSWKRLGSNSRGWRLGVSPVISDSSDDYGTTQSRRRQYGMALVATRLFLAPLRDRTRFYWGAGPTAGFDYTEDENTRDIGDGQEERSLRVTRTWWLGVRMALGVEYFFTGRMSLMGEYGFDVSYRKRTQIDTRTATSKTWKVDTRAARLGLSVLF